MDLPHILAVIFASVLGTTGLALATNRADSGSGKWRAFAFWLAWVLVKWTFYLVVSVLLISSIAGIPVLIVGAIVIAMAKVRRRVGQQYALLLALAGAANHQMPLVPVFDAFAEENRGVMGRRARRAARLLRAGCPLPQALAQIRGLVARDALATLRVGAESGSLAQSIREATETKQSFEPIWNNLSGKLLYFCVLTWAMLLIGSFMALKITPVFDKIFAEYGAELPMITRMIFDPGGSDLGVGTFLGCLSIPMFLLLVYVLARYIGWSGFDLPGMGPLVRRFHTAPILHALALSADRGMPFSRGIAVLASGYPRRSIRMRLQSVVVDLDAGADWTDSLTHHGLICQADRALLQAAQRVGNLSWALREIAASSRRRLVYRMQGLLQVMFVLVIVSFGLMVLMFAVGYFTPLVSLIRSQT